MKVKVKCKLCGFEFEEEIGNLELLRMDYCRRCLTTKSLELVEIIEK